MRNSNTEPTAQWLAFGWVADESESARTAVGEKLGSEPAWLPCAGGGAMFVAASGVDFFEGLHAITFRVGFLRSLEGGWLSAADLAGRNLADPRQISCEAITGNGVAGSIGRREPQVAAYATPMSTQPLYWTRWREGVVYSTDFPRLLQFVDRRELDELAAASHFLLAGPLGCRTHFAGIQRLDGGCLLTGRMSEPRVRRAGDLRSPDNSSVGTVDAQTTDGLYEALQTIAVSYRHDLAGSGRSPVNLLSGGVDSSLLQLLIATAAGPDEETRSCSYTVDSPGFQSEVEYAQQASRLLGSRHTLCELDSGEFPRLLERSVVDQGQPAVMSEVEVALLAVGERLAREADGRWGVFCGQGADGLFGMSITKKLLLADRLAPLPGSAPFLKLIGGAVERWVPSKGHGLKDVGLLLDCRKGAVRPFADAARRVSFVDLDQARRCFGDTVLLQILEERCELAIRQLGTDSLWEMAHFTDYLFINRQTLITLAALYARLGLELVPFFCDPEVVRLTRQFHPEVRYIRGLRLKPIPKLILERRGLARISRRPKLGSVFRPALHRWMSEGPLRDRVQAIDRPAFVSRADFERQLANPGYFLWSLLVWDIFQKQVVRGR